MDTIHTIFYAVNPGGGTIHFTHNVVLSRAWYSLYHAVHTMLKGESLIYCKTVNTRYTKEYALYMFVMAYTKYYTVFEGGGYYLYYKRRTIFRRWILFLQWNIQYLRVGYCIYCDVRSIVGELILFALCPAEYPGECILFLLCNTQSFPFWGSGYWLY